MRQFIPRPHENKSTAVWQIIYMDLMTIIMVFFVILWSVSRSNEVGIDDAIGEQTVRMITLPGDVLFPTGKWKLSEKGQTVFSELFAQNTEAVLNFDTGGLVKRLLVIHGHTDSVGEKDENLDLGYRRAFAVFKEIEKYGDELGAHVILCTHSDNTPAQEVPEFRGEMTPAQQEVLKEARAKNRRITIEDKLVNTYEGEQTGEADGLSAEPGP